MNYYLNEKRKLEQSIFEIKRRRINWDFCVKKSILLACEDFANMLKITDYPYEVHYGIASHDIGSQTIQFDYSTSFTGIEHNKTEIKNDRISHIKKDIYERGCSIVFSQGPTGNILVILSPYKSDVHQIEEENIILYSNCNPDYLTYEKSLSCLKKSLFYARVTSIKGASTQYSTKDKLKWFAMRMMDIRSRRATKRNILTLNGEWWKIIATALITIAFTILYQKLFPLTQSIP